jgi:hypothetical protein
MESSDLDRRRNAFDGTGAAILFDQIAARLTKDNDRSVRPLAYSQYSVDSSRGPLTIENNYIRVVFVDQIEEMGLDIRSIPCCREFPRRARDR